MDNIKVNLFITLPGSVMYSKESSFKNGKPVPERHNTTFIKLDIGRGRTETIAVKTRKNIPARQLVHVSEDAYNYYISDEKPSDFKGDWKKMSPEARLDWHMASIAESFNGELLEYQVLD